MGPFPEVDLAQTSVHPTIPFKVAQVAIHENLYRILHPYTFHFFSNYTNLLYKDKTRDMVNVIPATAILV